MSQMEVRERLAHKDIAVDLKVVLEKYRAIFSWDMPEVNVVAVDQVVLHQMALVLKELSQSPNTPVNRE